MKKKTILNMIKKAMVVGGAVGLLSCIWFYAASRIENIEAKFMFTLVGIMAVCLVLGIIRTITLWYNAEYTKLLDEQTENTQGESS